MIINMGPQHPSTHGVLRLMLELDGETVLRIEGRHRLPPHGMEKTAEDLMYIQGSTNVTRMDYLAPLFNETVFSMAVEELLGVELPERAVWIRMLLNELNRCSSHLLYMATNGMDVGAAQHDDLRLAGAGARARVPREGHGPADEPQLHPPRRRRRRPSRRVEARRPRTVAGDPPPGSTSTTGSSPASPSTPSGPRASASSPRSRRSRCRLRSHPALDRHRLGPPSRPAVHVLRPGRLRRRGRQLRRRLRPIRHQARGDPPEPHHLRADPRPDAGGRLPGPGQEDHPAAPRPDRRVDGSADPPLQALHRGLQGARRRDVRRHRVTPRRAGLLPRERRSARSRTACTSGGRASSTSRPSP